MILFFHGIKNIYYWILLGYISTVFVFVLLLLCSSQIQEQIFSGSEDTRKAITVTHDALCSMTTHILATRRGRLAANRNSIAVFLPRSYAPC